MGFDLTGKRSIQNKIARLLRFIYLKLFRINDSPSKVALGFGLGVFVAVMPGVGPVAALILAFIFRVNRASALLGSILFNTWLGIAIFLFAVQTGSAVMGVDYHAVCDGWSVFLKNFNWTNLLQVSAIKVLVPIGVGYFIISLGLGCISSVIVFMIAQKIKNKKVVVERS
ncbi:MAG: DUF2062 domain-containing protein [Candidatus Omnitrophica bacterium]|nr:DUF2062 domain-containing protein [Candidatus Omnitrophota bacterium]